jgi:hypothetical protein
MATYAQIQAKVKKDSGFVPKTCWIAHVMSDHKLTKRTAPNRINPKSRTHPCPDEKRKAIETVLRYYGMI